jgi:hypothetical protein
MPRATDAAAGRGDGAAASARRRGITIPFVFYVESPALGATAHFGL